MSLTQIAADLRRQAEKTGQPAKTVLARGLAISYKRIDRQCTLTAGRPGVHPSTDEAIIIARAFGVPLGTEPAWATVTPRPNTTPLSLPGRGAGGEGPTWHTITWRWLEEPTATQTQLLPAATTYP